MQHVNFSEIVPQVSKIKKLRFPDRDTDGEWSIERHDWLSLELLEEGGGGKGGRGGEGEGEIKGREEKKEEKNKRKTQINCC